MLNTTRMFVLLSLLLMILFSLGSGMLNTLYAQEAKQKLKIYKTWVYTTKGPPAVHGIFYKVRDSSILIANDYATADFNTIELHIDQVNSIQLRRKNSIAKWAGIGAATGFVVGNVVGWSYYGIFSSGDYGSLLVPLDLVLTGIAVIGFTAAGAGLGAGIGAIKMNIPINGSRAKYKREKERLQKYVIK